MVSMSIKSIAEKLQTKQMVDLSIKNPPVSKVKVPLTKEQVLEELKLEKEILAFHEAASNIAKGGLKIKK